MMPLPLRALIALTRAGVLRPLPPAKALAVVRAARRYGVSTAASAAINAARDPHGLALVDDQGTLTWMELEARAAALAAGLQRAHGVGPGASVAIMCRNHRGFVEALIATSQLGADALLLNTDFPGPQVAQALSGTSARVIVHDAQFAERLPAGVACVVADTLDLPPARPSGAPPRPGRVTILSSGTTGAPKGAGRAPSASALMGPVVTMLEDLRLRRGDPILIGPPIFHGFGLSFTMLGLAFGCPLVLLRRFTPEDALADLDRHAVVSFVGVPLMLQRILSCSGRVQLPRLRVVVAAGAPLPGHLATAFMDRFGDVVFNAYGSTETGWGALATPGDLRAAPGTVGRAPLGTSLRVLTAARTPAPPGTVGHIFVGGELVFDGYEGGGSKEVVDGHMNTGDLGHFDAAGRLFVDGREDDMIVSGGENVFPQEVEELLATHPDVEDVTVVGVPDDEFGQRLKAFVVGDAPEEELLAYVRRELARYKTPREVVFVDAIPRNPTGKVLRRELV